MISKEIIVKETGGNWYNSEIRESKIDSNRVVAKAKVGNTVLLKLSGRRFKVFLFAAKKRLRQSSDNNSVSVYLNENLSSYISNLIMKLQREPKRQREEGIATFESVYSFEGRVFVKRKSTDPSESAMLFRSEAAIKVYLQQFDTAGTFSN